MHRCSCRDCDDPCRRSRLIATVTGVPTERATVSRGARKPEEGSDGYRSKPVSIAAGAILAFAVNTAVQGVDLVAVGWILMAVGAVGLVLSIAFWNSWGGFGGN